MGIYVHLDIRSIAIAIVACCFLGCEKRCDVMRFTSDELSNRILPTVWESTRRLIWGQYAILILRQVARPSLCQNALRGIIDKELGRLCTHDAFYIYQAYMVVFS